MGLRQVVINAVETIFKVLKDAVKEGTYTVEIDNGFDTPSTETDTVRIILDEFRQEDVESSSYYELIQPTDTKGLVPGVDLTLAVKTSNFIVVEGRRFSIVAFDTDPFEALYTLLMRDT